MKINKLGLAGSFAIYISAALLMFVMTAYLIPWLSNTTGQETILFWFIVGGLGIFAPLLVTAYLILKSEGYRLTQNTWRDRLRFRKITGKDILWTAGGLVVVSVLSMSLMDLLKLFLGEFDHSPPFMSFEPLTRGRYWLLIVWAPYWILNIMGEEILWRGVMLPRQEAAFGKYTWLIHGTGWALFHVAFGLTLLITLLPLIYIQSFIVQKTKNSWTGVIMHAALNGPAFIAISLGLM